VSGRARRPPALLPRLGSSPWLVVAGLLIGIAAMIVVMVGAALARAQPLLAAGLAGSMTVVVSGRVDAGALESSDAAAARAREILAALPGVASVRVLEPAPVDAVVARILDAPPQSRDAGPPRLLAVVAATSPGAPAVAKALSREGLLFAVDDHGLWSGPCERAAALCGLAFVVALGLCLAGMAGVAAAAVGRRVDQAWPRLDLLSQFGADPGRLARAIAGPAVVGTLVWGLAGAAVGLGLCWWRWPASAPVPAPMPLVLGVAAAWLAAAALTAEGSARRFAGRRLRALFG
jgi:hypothetical protein